MKMRKRIAALIAAAMIASLMPMTAFAASSSHLNKTVSIKKDQSLTDDHGVELIIDMKDGEYFTSPGFFELKLTDAKWDDALNGTGDGIVYTLRKEGDKSLIVTASGANTTKIFKIPMLAEITGDDPTVEIIPWGSNVSAGKFPLAKATSGKAVITVGDAPVIAGTDKMADITFDEPFSEAFESGKTIILELRDSDFSFASKGVIEGTKAFNGEIDGDDARLLPDGTIEITMPPITRAQQGGFILKNATIRPSRNAREGDIKVTISGDLADKQVVTVAKYGDYTTTLEMKEDDYDVVAGQELEVEFTLSEDMKNAIISDRSAVFTFSKDIVIHEITAVAKKVQDDSDGNPYEVDPQVIFNSKNERTNVFEVDNFYPDRGEKSSYEFKATLYVPADFKGDITLAAAGRAFSDKLEVVVATTEAPATVEGEGAVLKVGIKKQVTDAKIVIKETAKDRLEQRKNLVIFIDDKDSGIKITDLDIEVTEGDLELDYDKDGFDSENGQYTIEIKRYSTEPSTIEITNIEFNVDRTVPQGVYDVKVSGSAISDLETTKKNGTDIQGISSVVATLEDFIVIGTPNTEDINKGKKAVVNFVIGNNKFLVDGVEMEMDAAPYIKDGRTMVPLRFLSTALGVDAESIKFNAGLVTIFAEGGKVIQVRVGSKDLVVNGMTIPMVAAAEIIDGRTYVPVTEIGGVFGVSGTWDAATQTATFK